MEDGLEELLQELVPEEFKVFSVRMRVLGATCPHTKTALDEALERARIHGKEQIDRFFQPLGD